MSDLSVIVLAGKAGSGKSTLAKYLASSRGYRIVKFADIIKDMLRVIGLTDHEIEGAGKEKPCSLLGDKTPRLAMQTLGTEWGRMTMYQNIWVDAWHRRVNEILQSGGMVVCDDARFPNEIEAAHKLGGYVFEIIRPVTDYTTLSLDPHISENHELEADVTLVNNGTITELYEKLEQFL
jgi:hypothetical protein